MASKKSPMQQDQTINQRKKNWQMPLCHSVQRRAAPPPFHSLSFLPVQCLDTLISKLLYEAFVLRPLHSHRSCEWPRTSSFSEDVKLGSFAIKKHYSFNTRMSRFSFQSLQSISARFQISDIYSDSSWFRDAQNWTMTSVWKLFKIVLLNSAQ